MKIFAFTLFLSTGALPWGKYLLVFSTSILKFFAGAFIAIPIGMGFWEIFLTTGLGSCLGTVIFTFFGSRIAKWVAENFKRSKPASFKTRRRLVKVWKKFGILGVAVLAPFISPPIAVAVGLSFRTPIQKLLTYLCTSFMIWAVAMGIFREGIWQLLNN